MSSNNLKHQEIDMSERERHLMKTHNLQTDQEGNLFPCKDTTSLNMPGGLEGRITINIQELASIVKMANGNPTPPPSPPSGLGNPGPLGLGGFALTTFVLSVFNTGVFLDPTLESVVLPLALFYGGLAQFIAGVFEFRAPNTFGATAFCSYGAFWWSFAAYVKYVAPGLNADTAHQATGLFLLAWLIFTTYMFVASLRVSKVVTLVFFFLVFAFLLLAIGAFSGNAGCTKAGGWIGIICAFCAWYGSAAVVINSTWNRTVFPVGVFIKEEPFWKSWTSFGRQKITLG